MIALSYDVSAKTYFREVRRDANKVFWACGALAFLLSIYFFVGYCIEKQYVSYIISFLMLAIVNFAIACLRSHSLRKSCYRLMNAPASAGKNGPAKRFLDKAGDRYYILGESSEPAPENGSGNVLLKSAENAPQREVLYSFTENQIWTVRLTKHLLVVRIKRKEDAPFGKMEMIALPKTAEVRALFSDYIREKS